MLETRHSLTIPPCVNHHHPPPHPPIPLPRLPLSCQPGHLSPHRLHTKTAIQRVNCTEMVRKGSNLTTAQVKTHGWYRYGIRSACNIPTVSSSTRRAFCKPYKTCTCMWYQRRPNAMESGIGMYLCWCSTAGSPHSQRIMDEMRMKKKKYWHWPGVQLFHQRHRNRSD